MSNTAKVAEIFINAGIAFSKLGELTMELQKDDAKSCGGKWTDEEIKLLKESICRFGQDIEKISQMVRSRTVKQIKEAMKRRNLLILKTSSDLNENKSLENQVETFHDQNETISNGTLKRPLNNADETGLSNENETPNKLLKETNINQIGSDHEIDVVNDTINNENLESKR